jgi:hypothetical protein
MMQLLARRTTGFRKSDDVWSLEFVRLSGMGGILSSHGRVGKQGHYSYLG